MCNLPPKGTGHVELLPTQGHLLHVRFAWVAILLYLGLILNKIENSLGMYTACNEMRFYLTFKAEISGFLY